MSELEAGIDAGERAVEATGFVVDAKPLDDVLLGWVAGCPYFIVGDQFDYWKHTALTLDVVPGRGSGFSVESPRGVRFLVRSRVLEPDELAELGEPLTGPEAMAQGDTR